MLIDSLSTRGEARRAICGFADCHSQTCESVIFDVECLTESCDHTSRHLYNTMVTLTVGFSWGVQLFCAAFAFTAVPARCEVAPRVPCLSSSASPPARLRQTRWGGKRMVARRLLGRSGRARQARMMSFRYSQISPSPVRSRPMILPMNACHALRNARRARLRHMRNIAATAAGGNHTMPRGPDLCSMAMAYPGLPTYAHDSQEAPLDSACTNHMRNSSVGFSNVTADDA